MSAAKNIILITIDDGGAYHRFRAAFGEKLQTPNLDRIAALSAMFTSAYCQAPICGPSRNSMLSGLSPHQTGILDNYTNLFEVLRPEQLWQYRLKQAGYHCATAGKVHHSFAPIASRHHNLLYAHPAKRISLGPPQSADVKRYGGLTGGAGTTDPADDALYYDHQSASDAVDFIESYDKSQPFYREIGFHHPHIPLKTPARFKDMYNEDAFKQPESWSDGFDRSAYPDRYMIENMDLRDVRFWRKSVRNYFSAYTHVDSQIGRVWDALQASSHAKNTVLIVTSDHGFHLGDKNRMRKFTLWEESCNVPLIIHDPDQAAREVDDPVALLDIGPTVLEYAGCVPLRGTQGRSLAGQVAGARVPDRAVPTFLFGNAAIRNGPYRIIRYETGETAFYDVEKDPWATRNLGPDHPDYAANLDALHSVSAAHGLTLGHKASVACRHEVAHLDGRPATTQPAPVGHRVHFATLQASGAAVLPNGFHKMNYGADTGGNATTFSAYGNAQDNEFVFPGSFNRFQLRVTPGPARNTVIAQNDDLIVYCGSGQNTVRPGNGRAVIYGGAGCDTLLAGGGTTWMDGGVGPATIIAGAGDAHLISGRSENRIEAGTGAAQIVLNGGINVVQLKTEKVTLTIKRTGLPQTIHRFVGGNIDLSDWAPLGTVQIAQDGPDTVLSAVTERIVLRQTDLAKVVSCVTGARCDISQPEDGR